MMKVYLIVFVCFLFCRHGFCQTNLFKAYDILELIDKSKNKSLSAKLAESILQNREYHYSNYKTTLKPQLTLFGNVADFSKDYLGVRQPDGTIIFQPRTQNYSSLGIGITQPVAFTGGMLTVNTALTRFDDFDRSFNQYNSIPVSIRLDQPLFAINGHKWNKRIEPLKYAQAQRTYVHELSNITIETIRFSFDVLDAQIESELARKNLEHQMAIFNIESKRVLLGTSDKDKLLQIKSQVLKSKQNLAQASVKMKSSQFTLRSFVGIVDTTSFQIIVPEKLPKINLGIEQAIEAARKNNPDFVANSIKLIEAQKELKAAKFERLKANLSLSYGLNGIATGLGSSYDHLNKQQNVTLGINIPILDWGRSKEKQNLASSNLTTTEYTIAQNESDITQIITGLVQNLTMLEYNVDISKEADSISQERFLLANDQLKYGKTTLSEFNVVLNEKDISKRTYLYSLRTYWETYYELKRLTGLLGN